MVELLSDPARCQVILVTLPEETPVNELVDTAYAVEDRAGVALGPIVVNGCMPPARHGDAVIDDGLDGLSRVRADATAAAVELGERELDALARAAEFRTGLLRRQAEQCRAAAPTGSRSPSSGCPTSSPRISGAAGIERLADELTLGIAALDDVTA